MRGRVTCSRGGKGRRTRRKETPAISFIRLDRLRRDGRHGDLNLARFFFATNNEGKTLPKSRSVMREQMSQSAAAEVSDEERQFAALNNQYWSNNDGKLDSSSCRPWISICILCPKSTWAINLKCQKSRSMQGWIISFNWKMQRVCIHESKDRWDYRWSCDILM